ncbi:MAG: TolC family protein [candidate division Zixibacteria bacterium]|nr:TolC family protein [candidate division Zixibacteria bacterium]
MLLSYASASAQSMAPDLGRVGQSDTLRRDQVIADVVRHNDRAAAARFMEEAERAKIGPAGAWDDPMLMAGVVNLPNSFDFREDMMTMTMVGVSQRWPYAGQKGLEAKAQAARAASAHEEARAITQDLVTAATLAYVDLYYHRRILADLESQRAIQEEIVASTLSRLSSNLAGQDEVLAAQAALWRLDAEILSHEADLRTTASTLNALRGADVDSPLPALADPTPGEWPEGTGLWLTLAEQEYAPMRRLRSQSDSYGFSAQAARRMSWPMLDLSANYGFRRDIPEEKRPSMMGFSATFTLPIFAGRQQRQMALSMAAMQRQSQLEAQQLRRNVEATLSTLHEHGRHMRESLALYRDRILPADTNAYRSALSGYAANRVPFTALLAYATAVYQDRITLTQTANELARLQAEVDRYTSDPDRWLSTQDSENER